MLLWHAAQAEQSAPESCGELNTLHASRDRLRAALRRVGDDSFCPSAKQIQRAFFNKAPANGVLEPKWAAVLDLIVPPARRSPSLRWAREALFAGGHPAWQAVCEGHPALVAAVYDLVGPTGRVSMCDAGLCEVLDDAPYPVYVSDPTASRVIWANRDLCAFFGLSRATLNGMSLSPTATGECMKEYAVKMMPPKESEGFWERQSQVIAEAPRSGLGYIHFVVDFGRRTWAYIPPHSRYSGVADVYAYAHLWPSEAPIGALVMYQVVPRP